MTYSLGTTNIDNVSTFNLFNSTSLNSENYVNPNADTPLFDTTSEKEEKNIEQLEAELQEIQDNNGAITGSWNKFKCKTNLGASSEKCEEAIDKYKNGEIEFDEAMKEIEKYDAAQKGSLNLFSNLATGIASIATATIAAGAIVASGGTATPFVLGAIGAGAGAITKTTYKMTDRATNNVENDVLDGKQIFKDAASGAISGAIAATTMGNGSACETLSSSIKTSAKGSIKTGALTGAISGGSNYIIENVSDENAKFNAKDLAKEAGINALASVAIGGAIGSTNGAMKYSGILKSGGNIATDASKINFSNTLANVACNAEYKLVRNGLDTIAENVA